MQHPNTTLILGRSDPEQLAAARDLGKPTIVLFDHDAARYFPAVLPDEIAIGKLAAQHLTDRGLRHLAYVGNTARWSRLRLQGLRLGALAVHAHLHPARLEPAWIQLRDTAAMARWLLKLPRPLGLFTANDEVATVARGVALDLGINIPEDLAILGVDNNELRVRYGRVTLSSIDVDAQRIGRTAVQLLLPYLTQPTPPPLPVTTTLIPPAGVVTRRSTNVLAIADPDIRTAVEFIAENACRGIDVSDVLAKVLISRSSLDRRMKATIGRSCSDEIARVRLMHARRLLRETDLPLSEVASACGYHYLSHFSHAFRKAMGVPPRVYRQASRNVSGVGGSGTSARVAGSGVDDGGLPGGRGVPTDGQPGGGEPG
ncbi:MAG: substrate-binding domain-containing protein [Tepidisphaerales bacterium]